MGATAPLHYSHNNLPFAIHYSKKNLGGYYGPHFHYSAPLQKNLPWGLSPFIIPKKICHEGYGPASLFPKKFAIGATAPLHYSQK